MHTFKTTIEAAEFYQKFGFKRLTATPNRRSDDRGSWQRPAALFAATTSAVIDGADKAFVSSIAIAGIEWV